MAGTDQFNVAGAAEMAKVLRLLPDRVADKALAGAVLAAANVVKKEMRTRAPVRSVGGEKKMKSKTRAPGHLAKHIIARRDKKTNKSSVSYQVGLSPSAFYGMFLEFGTRYISARPFMRPAFDVAAKPAVDKMGERLGKNIEREATKLAGKFSKSGMGVKRGRR